MLHHIASTLLSRRPGIETFKHCVPGKNMLPSGDMSGAFTGIFTVSTEDSELIGVLLTCKDHVNN
jgi:hypothetical protein